MEMSGIRLVFLDSHHYNGESNGEAGVKVGVEGRGSGPGSKLPGLLYLFVEN